MDRKFAILLSICLAVLCAFVYRFATQSLSELSSEGDQATIVSCEQLLKKWPSDNYHLRLTNYQRGKQVVAYDRDQDGNWEKVYVPLFPAHLTTVGNNYNSVIVYFDDVKNEVELDERLSAEALDTQLWYTQQTLPVATHSEMAQHYRLMDFSRCVVLQGGFQPPNKKIATYAVLGSYLGLIACGIVAVWNLVAMLIPMLTPKRRPNRFFNDDEDDDAPITNRAGLPEY